jgi:serine/threonine-protein kinase HipA
MKQVEVLLDLQGETVMIGTLRSHGFGRRERASFEYASSYLAHPQAYAIDPALPLLSGTFETPTDRAMFGAFMDVAPDQWGRRLLQRAVSRGVAERDEALSEFDFIVGVRDDMRQGNLRVRGTGDETFLAHSDAGFPPTVELANLLDAAAQFDAENDDDAALELLLAAGSSIGGARPKAAVIDDEEWLSIAKFPRSSTDEWDVMAWERLALILARRCGIVVPDSQLIDVRDNNVLVVRRFDRTPSTRIGYVSAMTMLEAKDGDAGSYVDIAEVITEEGLAVNDDLRQLWRRIAFSIAISNTDDHLRNHGFLRDDAGNGWNLSPAFDLNPEPRAKRPLLITPIRPGEHEADIRLLLEEVSTFRLPVTEAMSIAEEVDDVVADWQNVATTLGIPEAEQRRVGVAFRGLPVG